MKIVKDKVMIKGSEPCSLTVSRKLFSWKRLTILIGIKEATNAKKKLMYLVVCSIKKSETIAMKHTIDMSLLSKYIPIHAGNKIASATKRIIKKVVVSQKILSIKYFF